MIEQTIRRLQREIVDAERQLERLRKSYPPLLAGYHLGEVTADELEECRAKIQECRRILREHPLALRELEQRIAGDAAADFFVRMQSLLRGHRPPDTGDPQSRREYVLQRMIACALGRLDREDRDRLLDLARAVGPEAVEEAERFNRHLALHHQARLFREAAGLPVVDEFVFSATVTAESWEVQP